METLLSGELFVMVRCPCGWRWHDMGDSGEYDALLPRVQAAGEAHRAESKDHCAPYAEFVKTVRL